LDAISDEVGTLETLQGVTFLQRLSPLLARFRDDACEWDRGYAEFSLFNAIVAADSSYICRVLSHHHFTVEENLPPTAEASAAGVLEDSLGRMGSPQSKRIEHPDPPQRRIVVRLVEHPKRGGRRRRGSQDIVLVTNLLDVPAEVIALLYHFRWLIELFIRWLECVLSCRHLISQNTGGHRVSNVPRADCLPIDPTGGGTRRTAQSMDVQAALLVRARLGQRGGSSGVSPRAGGRREKSILNDFAEGSLPRDNDARQRAVVEQVALGGDHAEVEPLKRQRRFVAG